MARKSKKVDWTNVAIVILVAILVIMTVCQFFVTNKENKVCKYFRMPCGGDEEYYSGDEEEEEYYSDGEEEEE